MLVAKEEVTNKKIFHWTWWDCHGILYLKTGQIIDSPLQSYMIMKCHDVICEKRKTKTSKRRFCFSKKTCGHMLVRWPFDVLKARMWLDAISTIQPRHFPFGFLSPFASPAVSCGAIFKSNTDLINDTYIFLNLHMAHCFSEGTEKSLKRLQKIIDLNKYWFWCFCIYISFHLSKQCHDLLYEFYETESQVKSK